MASETSCFFLSFRGWTKSRKRRMCQWTWILFNRTL